MIWASDKRIQAGAIVQRTSEDILPTEFFYDPATGRSFQPHYQVIDEKGHVQIYEKVAKIAGKDHDRSPLWIMS